MDKINLVKILQKQALNFDDDVQHKLSALLGDDYVFMDAATYTNIINSSAKSDIDLLHETFDNDYALEPQPIPSMASKKIAHIAQRLEDIIQEQTIVEPPTSSLQDKIAALRGCSLPGSYLMK